jgi:hypothetical protein
MVKQSQQADSSASDTLSVRDTGPYSTRNLAKGACITDAVSVFAALRSGLTIEQVRDGAYSGKLLPQRGRASRERIWASLNQRYFVHGVACYRRFERCLCQGTAESGIHLAAPMHRIAPRSSAAWDGWTNAPRKCWLSI